METATLLKALQQQAAFSLLLMRELSSQELDGKQDLVLRHCVERSVELAGGCKQLAEKELPASTTIIARALLELLFLSAWITLSEENAIQYENASKMEMRRQARLIANAGYAKFRDPETGKDITKSILNSDNYKHIKRLPRIQEMAEATGLTDVYKTVYGYVSMIAHANDFSLFASYLTLFFRSMA